MSSSARNVTSKPLTEDKCLLVRALLEVFESQGGRVLYPATDNEDALLSRLHVRSLLETVKTAKYVDIGKLTLGEQSESPFALEGVDPGMEAESTSNVALAIHQLHVALDENELQELAFVLFCLFCVEDQTPLTTSMRRQLELSATCAEDIIKVAKRVRVRPPDSTSGQSESGVDLLLQLLKDVRPNDFRNFRDFLKWRDVVARVLVTLMKESVSGSNMAEGVNIDDIRLLLANLKGALRRLCFIEQDEYEEREYADAVLCVASIAQRMIPYSKSGFSFTWGLRMRLWETLLMALFDGFEDDLYIDEMEDVQNLLIERLAPRLQISMALHTACFAWVHFKQLNHSLDPHLIPVLKILLTRVNTNDPALDELDGLYTAEISRVCFASITEILMDYHARLPDPEILPGMVDLFLTMIDFVPPGSSSIPSVEDIIRQSCLKAFQRMEQRLSHDSNLNNRLKKLAQRTKHLYETELRKHTDMILPYCPRASSVAAAALHDCFGQELKPVLYELQSIPEDVVQMLKAADALDKLLLKAIRQDPSIAKSIVPWNVMDAISELLFNWVDRQLHKIKQWRERLCEKETWQETSDATPLALSATEFKKLLEESIALVFGLDLIIPGDLVSAFVTGLANSIESYGKTVLSDIRNEEGKALLIPKLPELTRYKKDLADAAALKEVRSMEAKPHRRHSRLKSILVDPGVTKMVPLIEDSENYQWFKNLKTNTLVVRINSLHFMKDSVPDLTAMIEMQCRNRGQEDADDVSGRLVPLRAAGVFLEKCTETFCTFLATKIIFWDGRLPWLEQLYRHHVSTSRIDFILIDLHKNLTDINAMALTSIRDKIVQALLEACVQCLHRVLLDGGPYRLFKAAPNDRELIEEDVKKLKDLFNDKEEGLPMVFIEETIKPITEVLLKMTLSTSDLVQLAEDAKRRNSTELAMYMQILGHRADRAASKWLKKAMKTPKKIKTKL